MSIMSHRERGPVSPLQVQIDLICLLIGIIVGLVIVTFARSAWPIGLGIVVCSLVGYGLIRRRRRRAHEIDRH